MLWVSMTAAYWNGHKLFLNLLRAQLTEKCSAIMMNASFKAWLSSSLLV